MANRRVSAHGEWTTSDKSSVGDSPSNDASSGLLLGVPAAACQEGGVSVVDADAAHVVCGVVAHAALGSGHTRNKKLGHALAARGAQAPIDTGM